GEGIPLAEYQAELQRYQAAFGTELATDQKEQVLNDLIDQVLLAQAASKASFTVDDAMVEEHLKQLQDQMGGESALQSWMQALHYSHTDLKQALSRQIAATWMREKIFADTPKNAEQVHARQILLYQADKATQVLELLKSGKDFAALAEQYDPLTYGDLGWFPRGFLLDAKLEEVIFALAPGAYSDVIQTAAGYHIVQLIEKDPNRPLEADTYQAMQLSALHNWLAQQRQSSQIEILVK
ncbi:MAG: peptidylprolyl isomerase, partial [Anaerolineales bacterium]